MAGEEAKMDEQHPSTIESGQHSVDGHTGVTPPPIPNTIEAPVIDTPVWPVSGGGGWHWLLLGLLALLILGFTVNKVVVFDVWWHLEAGKYFLDGGPLAGEDPFSFTAQGEEHRWIEGHWLFQILLALLYKIGDSIKIGGINLLILFKAALVCFAFFLVYRFAEGRRSPILVPFIFGLAVLAVAERFIVRPETASYLFIAGYILILEAYRRKPRISLLAWLVALQLLWVNVQGLFALGLVLIGCYLAGELVRWRINLPYQWDARNPLKDRAFMMLLGTGVVCLLVCLANPSGIHGALFPLEQFQMIQGDDNIFRQNIAEFHRPFAEMYQWNPATKALIVLLVVSLTSFILNFKRWDLTRVLLFGLFLFIGISARRNIALFALVAAPLTVINFRQWASSLGKESLLRRAGEKIASWRPVMAVAVAVFLCFGLWQAVSDNYFLKTVGAAKFGLGVNSESYPVAAADLIIKRDLQGNLYNQLGFGGYLIHRLYPERKIFIDGRNELYGEEFFKRYIDLTKKPISDPMLAQLDPDSWDKLVDDYNLQLALLNVRVGYDNKLIKTLYDSPKWALIQHDGTSALFARRGGDNAQAISILEQDFSILNSPPPNAFTPVEPRRGFLGGIFPIAEIKLGEFYSNLGFYDLAGKALERAVELDSGNVDARLALGKAYMNGREFEKALQVFGAAIAQVPGRTAEIRLFLGQEFFEAGEIDKSIEQFELCIVEEPSKTAEIRLFLGQKFIEEGEMEKAVEQFDLYLAVEPGKAFEIRSGLGQKYLEAGEMEKALAQFERLAQEDPEKASDVRFYVGQTYLQSGETEKAIDQIKTVIETDSDRATDARIFLGEIYAQAGEMEKALEQFQIVIRVEPAKAVAYERMGSVLHNTGRVEQALSNYKRALDRGMDTDLLRTNMGDCYLQMNLPEEALVEFERAVEMNPGNPDMRYNVAFAHQVLIEPAMAAGDEAEAQRRLDLCLEEYLRVLEIDPQHFRTLFNLGLIYSGGGQLAEARQCFLSFLAIPGVDENYRGEAQQYLAQIEGQMGQAPANGPLAGAPVAGPLAGGAE